MSVRVSIVSVGRFWSVVAARLCICLLVWAAVLPEPASSAPGREPERVLGAGGEPKHVLLLHSFGRDFKPWSEYALSIRAELERQAPWPLDLQEQTLVAARFNERGPEAPFVEYLRLLYVSRPPDLVMSIGAPAAKFVQKYREQLFPQTPTVLMAVEQRVVNHAGLTENDTVISVNNDFAVFFRNILQVLPDTRTIAVVIGASPLEKFWLGEIKKETKAFEHQVQFVWYDDLSFEDILKQASALPPHTAIFWHLMSVDAAGVAHEGDIALRSLHAVANAPVFSYQEAFFGGGAVGGPVHAVGEVSRQAVAAAIRILMGEKAANIKIEPIGFGPAKYDWREMQRWGISESNLPPVSQILFREPTFWEKYRWQVALIGGVVLVQAVLIIGLLHERRRRRLAEVESRQRLAELAHLNRYSAAGELTTSIAHELNQPLGSILTNTETAELMLKSASPDLDEIREILADIRRDDQRASEVIKRLRSMLKREPFEISELDLNEVVGNVVHFLSALANGRGVALKYIPAWTALRVKGDAVQLHQVVLNLIMNAIDAVSESQSEKREVVVAINAAGNQAEILVSDSGPGIAADHLNDVFDPFFTTKTHGMGMGLAIARTIVEAHHGHITAANGSPGGAAFWITLPLISRS